MAVFEFLMIAKESALGTVMGTPVLGTDKFYLRLTDGNSFSMQAVPQYVDIPYGGGEAITVESLSEYTDCKGTLTTKLYPSQAAILFNWAQNRINSGQTSPWTTTEPPGDLASMSVYHAYQRSDGTLKRTRYAGVKVTRWQIAASATDPVFKLTLDLQAVKEVGNPIDSSSDPDATEFPAPADTDLPSGPYLFRHSSGGLLLGSSSGTVRTQYDDFSLDVTNTMDARPFESQFIQMIAFRGRASMLNATLRLKATPDDLTSFLSGTAQRAQLTLANGTTTTVIDYKSSNKIRQLTRDLPLDRAFMYRLQMKNVRDASAGTDISVTVT